MTLATQRVKTTGSKGFKLGTNACDRCLRSVQLMCHDRAVSGRAVLCEVLTEEERQDEYAPTQQP